MNGVINQLFTGAVIALAANGSVSQVQAAQGSAQCAPIDTMTVEAQFGKFTNAWATGDAKNVAQLFTLDAVLLATVSNTPRTTPTAITDYFEHFLIGRPVARINTSTIRLGCGSAARFGTWAIDLRDPKTGAKSVVPARYTFIYKFENGQWLIDHLHSSKMPEISPGH